MIFKPSGAEKENEDDEISPACLQHRAPFYKQAQLTKTVIIQRTMAYVGENRVITSQCESETAAQQRQTHICVSESRLTFGRLDMIINHDKLKRLHVQVVHSCLHIHCMLVFRQA